MSAVVAIFIHTAYSNTHNLADSRSLSHTRPEESRGADRDHRQGEVYRRPGRGADHQSCKYKLLDFFPRVGEAREWASHTPSASLIIGVLK